MKILGGIFCVLIGLVLFYYSIKVKYKPGTIGLGNKLTGIILGFFLVVVGLLLLFNKL